MEKKKINAKIIADSIDERGNRITSYILTYPRIIHAEVMTHRMFSRNAASSRAIPFAKMVKDIQDDPFIPIAWQKDHKGMQGTEYITDSEIIEMCKHHWLRGRDFAVHQAHILQDISVKNYGVTKQLCNRLLEPFQWYTCLVTATEFDNFFELRCPKYWLGNPMDTNLYKSRKEARKSIEDIGFAPNPTFDEWTDTTWLSMSAASAEVHIQLLSEAMWDARNESIPKYLKGGEWHIPFGDKIELAPIDNSKWVSMAKSKEDFKVKVATARCARLSYMTFDGEIDYEKDIKLHDQLLESKHFSPFEHCSRAMDTDEWNKFQKGVIEYIDGEKVAALSYNGWCNNFKGFIPYRYLLE